MYVQYLAIINLMTDRTKAAYGNFARYYDSDDNPLILLEHQPVVKAVTPNPRDHLLEAACGTGRYIKNWLDRGAEVSGFDFSEEMLEIARHKFPELDLIVANLDEHLPYDNESFNVVNCSQALKHISDPGLCLREFCRITAPGGRVVFSVTHPDMTWDDFIMVNQPEFLIGQEADVFHHSFEAYRRAIQTTSLVVGEIRTVKIGSRIRPMLTPRSFEQVCGRPMVAIFILHKP